MSEWYLENVWEEKSEEIKKEIIAFWLAEKAIQSRQEAEQRVDQVFFVVRDSDKKIIGINTVYKIYNQQLENYFYYYRTYISPKARKFQMIGNMLFKTRDFLESRFIDKTDTQTIGMFLEIENEDIKNKLNLAIWPDSKFVYIGKNQQGDHLRVYYFKHAKIS